MTMKELQHQPLIAQGCSLCANSDAGDPASETLLARAAAAGMFTAAAAMARLATQVDARLRVLVVFVVGSALPVVFGNNLPVGVGVAVRCKLPWGVGPPGSCHAADRQGAERQTGHRAGRGPGGARVGLCFEKAAVGNWAGFVRLGVWLRLAHG